MKNLFRNKRSLFLVTLFFQIITVFFASHLFAAEKPVIVVFKDKPGYKEVGKMKLHNGKIKRIHPFIKAISVTLNEAAIAQLSNDPQIAYIEEDVMLSLVTPQAGGEFTDSWGVGHIGALSAHAAGFKGNGIKVAVIDTGIDYMHQDLIDNYKGGYDFVFEDADPYDDSYNSHGTHVSGIIAAAVNGTGIVGVAPEASLYAVKVLDGAGFGMLSDILAGIEWSVLNGMDVINLSFGSIYYIQSLEDACNNAYDNGVLIVAAAGNSKGGEVVYPAKHSSVVAVSAIDANDTIGSFVAIGPEVEFAAPGINILSTVTPANGNYGYLHGTSQAAPYVAGAAAVLLSSGKFEDLNGDGVQDHKDVRLTLIQDALDLGTAGFDELYGYGMVRLQGFGIIDQFTIIASNEKKKSINGYNINLATGAYDIYIKNNDLYAVKVSISEKQNGEIVSKRTGVYNFLTNADEEKFTLDLSEKEAEVVFYPIGEEGTSADIRVTEQGFLQTL